MKRLIIVMLLSLTAIITNAQKYRTGIQDYATVVALRGENQITPKQNDKVVVIGTKGIFTWDATSTATDDGQTVIKQTNIVTGRWVGVGGVPPNVRYGTIVPTVLGTDKIGDEYLRTSSGTNSTPASESYVYDGTVWKLRPKEATAGFDIGYVVGWSSNTLPPDYLLPLSGGTFLWSNYPDLQTMHASYPIQFIASSTGTTFTLVDINTTGRFLRGGTFAGVNQTQSTAVPNAGWTVSGAIANGTTNPATGATAQNQFGLVQVSGGGSNTLNINDVSPGEPNGIQNPFNHNHSVTGGDAETRPINTSIIWCLKAKPISTSGAVTITTLPQNNNQANVIFAKGTINIGDFNTAILNTSTQYNVASSNVLSGSGGSPMIMQVNFATALPSTDYYINGVVYSNTGEATVAQATTVFQITNKTTSGFQVVFRETASTTQNSSFDFNVNMKAPIFGSTLTAGSNINITNGVISATSTLLSGNIISIQEKVGSTTQVAFDNLLMRWNGVTDRYEIATASGTEIVEWTTRINYGSQLGTVNGGAGVDGTTQGTPITVTTTFQVIGDAGLVGVEDRTYNIWSQTTGNHYRANTIRKGTTTTDGWATFIIEKIGVSTTSPMSAGTGISISSGTINNTGVITSSNGLTTTSNDVKLGGALSQNTDITTGAFIIGLGTDAGTGDINIGTGAGARNINIGNATVATGISAITGTTGMSLTGTNTLNATLNVSNATSTNGATVFAQSTSTAKATGSSVGLFIGSGALATAGLTTNTMNVQNIHTGTNETNVALRATAQNGTNNYAIIVPAGSVGIGNIAPTSTFHLTGSEAKTTTTTALAAYTLLATDNTIFLTLAGTQTITVPAANICSGRIYRLINTATNFKTVSTYTTKFGNTNTTIYNRAVLVIQSDGTVWREVDGNNNSATLLPTRTSVTLGGVTFTVTFADPMVLTTSVTANGFFKTDIVQYANGVIFDYWTNGTVGAGGLIQRGGSATGTTRSIGIYSTAYSSNGLGHITANGLDFRITASSAGATTARVVIELIN